MSWVVRGGRRYYYRSFRDAGGVRRRYEGAGPYPEALAALAEARRRLRVEQRDQLEEYRARVGPAERAFADLARRVGLVVRTVLEAAGFHRHDRGAWRRRRHPVAVTLLDLPAQADQDRSETMNETGGELISSWDEEVMRKAMAGDQSVLPDLA